MGGAMGVFDFWSLQRFIINCNDYRIACFFIDFDSEPHFAADITEQL